MNMNNVFMYWQNYPGKTMPEYIQLCIDSIIKHCSKDFKINLLNDQNVYDFLPESKPIYSNIAQINNRSNYLRYHLLEKWGGIWADVDCILFRSLKPLLDLFDDDIDLIATASPGLTEPECGILISKPNGKVITKAAKLIDYELNLHRPGHIFKWGGLGPQIVRSAVKGLKYHHLNSKLIMPIASWNDFLIDGIECLDKYCNKNSYGVMLFNEMFKRRNSEILTMTKEQLMKSPKLIGQIFRKALDENP